MVNNTENNLLLDQRKINMNEKDYHDALCRDQEKDKWAVRNELNFLRISDEQEEDAEDLFKQMLQEIIIKGKENDESPTIMAGPYEWRAREILKLKRELELN